MLKRKMYDYLLRWKETKKKECLLIKGARQVGKTFCIRVFGQKEYESYIEINFQEQPQLKGIFDGDRTAEEIYKRMSANIPNIHFVEGKTLIFLDEIQKCANARTALKFLALDGRYDVIASGSLLGLTYGQDGDKEVEEVESIPVGYEKSVMMYSLDFEEFLWAYGYDEKAISYLKEYFIAQEKIPFEVTEKYNELLKEFIVTGGMPEVVSSFVEYKNFSLVQEIQEKILNAYIDDITHHANGIEKTKVKKCYETIPSQLARENKKFKYSAVESKATARKYGESVEWIANANMALVCCNVNSPNLPLNAYEKRNEFKLYMNDTGLLMARFGFETKRAFLNDTLIGFAKGGIYENFVAETLVKNGYTLHYYKPSEEMELEFLIEKNGEVVPIEVKAGNKATKSLNRFMEDNHSKIAYKLIQGNIGISNGKISIPHFLTMFL